MSSKKSKRTTRNSKVYFAIINLLRETTNLGKIQEELNISKQQLNYYLRQLKKKGFVYNKGYGWWELTEKSKSTTKYHIFLEKDDIRGHAYIWEIPIEEIPEKWSKRIDIVEKKGINFKIVGAKENTPRIKVLGRKVWLCNKHLRIFDKEKSSYYGKDAIEARKNSYLQAFRIVRTLEKKLGLRLNPNKIKFKKEHYALVRNDLAIDQNQKGIIWRIKDENGEEWLLIDDSLGEGGELENVGKSAFNVNPKMQKWWNSHKETDFKVTPTFILENMDKLIKSQTNQSEHINSFAVALNRHIPAYEGMAGRVDEQNKILEMLGKTIIELKEEIKELKKK